MSRESAPIITAGIGSAFLVEIKEVESIKKEPFNTAEDAQRILRNRWLSEAAKGLGTTAVFATSLAAGVSVFADYHVWTNFEFMKNEGMKGIVGVSLIAVGTQSRVVLGNTIRRINLISRQQNIARSNRSDS